MPFREIRVSYRVGRLFIDNTGKLFAFLGKRADRYVLNINGHESETFEQILPIGF